jgi:GNAT superfamily N-acetyltransferase
MRAALAAPAADVHCVRERKRWRSAIIARVRFVLTRDAEEFAARAERFLAERVERNVLATVLVNARRGRFVAQPPLFAAGLDEGHVVRAAALRVPPWPLLVSELDGAAADQLIGSWLAEDPDIPGVSADPATARAVAIAWTRRTGGRSHCRMREAMHLLREVHAPQRPARGRLRPAASTERELLVGWEKAFALEANVAGGDEAARSVDRRLANGSQFVWDDAGAFSTLALSPSIAGTVRIGPVYTPPEYRRRGYATTAVAAASERALSDGARQCMLFTDLANPTSNKIYAAIGFRLFANWEEHTFLPA